MTVYNATGTGSAGSLQTHAITQSAFYRITAAGAGQNSVPEQRGARIRGDFELEAGDVLHLLCGHLPTGGQDPAHCGAGGTFVLREADAGETPHQLPDGTYVELLVAAGGAGGVSDPTAGSATPEDAAGQGGTRGGDSSGTEQGGDDGLGGKEGNSCFGQSGAGFLGDGEGCDGALAQALLHGGNGATGGNASEGGYGGGGTGRTSDRLGGGGGYSGGAARGGADGYGGGGGSYNAGANQENHAGFTVEGNDGAGWADIELLQAPPGDTVDDAEATAHTASTLALEWGPTGTTDDYKVAVEWGGALEQSHVVIDPQIDLIDLPPETEIAVTITPSNEHGDGTGTTYTYTMPPDAEPQDAPAVTVTKRTQALDLSWPFVVNAEAYAIRLRTPLGAALRAEVVTTGLTATIADLDYLTTYRVQVLARNSHGDGPAWNELLTTLLDKDGGAVALALRPADDAQIEATIDPDKGLAGTVVDVNSNPLEGHAVHVYARATGDREATVFTDASGEWNWTGADPDAEYFVVAINPDAAAEDYAPPASNRLQPVTINE